MGVWTPRLPSALLVLLVLLGVQACDDARSPTGPPSLQRLEVQPLFARVSSAGDSARFQAWATFSDGTRVATRPTWISSAPEIVAIDEDGWATALALGSAAIEARYEDERGVATMLVNADTRPPDLLDVFAASSRVTLAAGPVTVPITAELRDEGSGVRSALAFFDGPLGAGITGLVTLSLESEEHLGDSAVVSVFTGSLEIPGLVGAGTWILEGLQAEDRAGNARRWGAEELAARGLTVEIVASTGSDEE